MGALPVALALALGVLLASSGGAHAEPATRRYGVAGEERLTAHELELVEQLAGELGTEPRWLLGVISFETNNTFSPAARNPKSGATGLIQFTRKTAELYGTTIDALGRMSWDEQWPYVRRHFMPYKGKLRSYCDTYLAVFWPAGIGKPDDEILIRKDDANAQNYAQNKGLDRNANGEITRAEVCQTITGALRAPPPAPALPPSGPVPGTVTVLVMGDSIGEGIGEQLLASRAGVANRAAANTFVSSVKPADPALEGAHVILATTTNDLATKKPLEELAGQLEDLAAKLEPARSLRILVPLHPLAKEPLRSRAQEFSELLTKRGRFVDGVLVRDPTPERDRSSDGIHYTPAGYKRLAELLTR